MIHSNGRKNQKRGAVSTASYARAVIRMDTGVFGHIFASTGIEMGPPRKPLSYFGKR